VRPFLAAVALLLGLVAGCAALPPIPGSGSAAGTSGAVAPAAPAAPAPQSVQIPTIKVSSSLVPTGLNPDGTAQTPPVDQPEQASYLKWAASQKGRPLVIYGHVNGVTAAGKHVPGVFTALHTLKPGAQVTVGMADGKVATYRVTKVQQVSKHADPARNDPGFPTKAVYDPTPKPEIRLVTCGGAFDAKARSYVDNFIVFGERLTV
jgi:hypothetical protein